MCQVTVFWSRGERYDSDSDETYGFVVEDAPPTYHKIRETTRGRNLRREAVVFYEGQNIAYCRNSHPLAAGGT